jgi:hypothetical protein
MVEIQVSTSIVNIKRLLAVKHDQPESICPCTASHRKGELPLTASQCCQGYLNPQPTLRTTTSSPERFSSGLGYPTSGWHPASPNKFIEMIITESQFTSFIHLLKPDKQINETDKQLMHQGLANDQMDHGRHQLMLKQATTHIRPSLCDAYTAQSEPQRATERNTAVNYQANDDQMIIRAC